MRRLPVTAFAAPTLTVIAATAAPHGAQGDTPQSILQLPDWSGAFALDQAGHEFAGRESR